MMGCVITTVTNGASLECSINIPFTLPDGPPGELGDSCPRRPGSVTRAPSPNMPLPGERFGCGACAPHC
jgi:hypothetical protein